MIYGIGQVIGKFINFLLMPLLTSYLSPSDYGIISLLNVLTFVAAPLFGLGLGISLGIVYFRQNGDVAKTKLIWTAFSILLVSSTVFISIVFTFKHHIALVLLGQSSSDTSIFLIIVSFSMVLGQVLCQPFISRLQFENRAKLFITTTTITTLINILFTVFFVVIFPFGLKGFLLASLFASIVSFIIYFVVIISWTPFGVDFTITGHLLRLGLPLVPSFIFLFLIQNSGRYLLQSMRGLSDVGIYSIGNTFALISQVAVSAFTTAWYPYFSSYVNRQDEARVVLREGLTYFVLILGSICVLIFLSSKALVFCTTSTEFHRSYTVIGILSVGHFLFGTFSVLTPSMYFAKKTYLVSFVQALSALAAIGLSYLLIPQWGIEGASIAFALSVLTLNGLQIFLNKKMKFLEVSYDWIRISKLFAIFFLFCAASLIPRNLSLCVEICISLGAMSVFSVLMFLNLKPHEKSFVKTKVLGIKDRILNL